MKRSAREKNSIIITFLFYFILVISLLLFILLNTKETLKKIEFKKIDTQKIYEEIVTIEKEGLNFEKFKSLSNSLEGNKESQEILKNINIEFFDKHLKNINNESFEEFIKEKTEELNSEKNNKLVSDNEKQIINILPTYSESDINIGSQTLTDFQFINYVESIIESFNLTTNASIGIGNINLLEEYSDSNAKGGSLDSNIFEIPLSMNLEGTKSNIIDFLYFIEKVGTINTEGNEILINKESNFLSINGFSKVLAGDNYVDNYNIFENQIIDISNISMSEYIDSSYNYNNTNFINFIKESQGNEDFQIKVNLLFYVKGQPKYKILNFINSVMTNFKVINSKTNFSISKGGVKGIELLKLKKRQNLLKNLNTKVISINKEVRLQKDIDVLYKKSIDIWNLIKPICSELDKGIDDEKKKICKKLN